MSRRGKVLLLTLLGVLIASFLYLRVLSHRVFFQAPQHAEEALRTRLSEAVLQSPAGPSQTATLYFPSLNDNRLVPESRLMTWAETDVDRVRQVLLALVEGSRQGLGHALPPSTAVRSSWCIPPSTKGTAFRWRRQWHRARRSSPPARPPWPRSGEPPSGSSTRTTQRCLRTRCAGCTRIPRSGRTSPGAALNARRSSREICRLSA